MPAERVRIRSVIAMPTARHGVTRFTINAETIDGRWTKQYQTINAWLGSLCERVREMGQIADVVWVDSQYGPQLVSVDPTMPAEPTGSIPTAVTGEARENPIEPYGGTTATFSVSAGRPPRGDQ